MAKILIVEDDKGVCENIAYYFEAMGYCALTAFDGKQGYELFELNCPQAVIVDIELPEMNGLRLIEKIRQSNAAVPIFVVTAYATQEHLLQAVRLKLEDFIVKPLTSKKIHHIIASVANMASKELKVLGGISNLSYSFTDKRLHKGAHAISLSHLEIRLLELLLEHEGKVVPYQTIEHTIYESTPTRNALKSLARKLRTKLDGCILECQPKLGYKLICLG